MRKRIDLEQLFILITKHPKLIILVAACFLVASSAGLLNLVKNTSVDAFVPSGHASLLANELKTNLFGLSDPIAVAVFTKDGSSVFNADTLSTIEQLTLSISQLSNIRENRIASITEESSIRGENGSILIDAYFDSEFESEQIITASAERWSNMPPHINTLVSKNESGAVIMAELVDSNIAAETYAAVEGIVSEFRSNELEILVAGPAAVSGFLSQYIDTDARVLQPVVFLIVALFLYLAFLKSSALVGPLVVLLGSAGGALGLMAWQGVPYFAITNALPVILVAISVADAIHILSAYYEGRARFPDRPVIDLVIDAMVTMARPITLTTLTTMAGFFGIAVVSIMPPIAYFGWYAMLGVFLAWVFSLAVLPCVLVLVKPKPSPAFSAWSKQTPDRLGSWLANLSNVAARNPFAVLGGFAAIVALALYGAMDMRIDRSQVDNFSPDEPIRLADERINAEFAGTAFLDVIVTTNEAEGLLNARYMAKIAALQEFLERQPHVTKTVSIVDYLHLLHAAIEQTPASHTRELPTDDAAIAQYLMVYESSGDPADLEEEITPDYDAALVRGVLNSHYFSDSRVVVEALALYLQENFNEPGLKGIIAGDVNVAYHWMTRLQESHFLGVGLSLLLILSMAIVMFRSISVGLIAVIPVSFTVLSIYGLMGYLGIHLEPATSMFAAISVGVGVDFAIHLVDRIRTSMRTHNQNIHVAIATIIPGTARACFFNAAALGVGFSVLLVSGLPTLQRFGGLVALASVASFIAALVIAPVLLVIISKQRRLIRARRSVSAVVVLCGVLISVTSDARAGPLNGRIIAQHVADRTIARASTRTINMTLTDRRGRQRMRQAIIFRQNLLEQKGTRITYTAPKPIRDLTFLSKAYDDRSKTDERWLFIPAARKVRRIPASARGDYFLGTDFTYEDMQSDLKFSLSDYTFTYHGESGTAGERTYSISGLPISDKIARQLGYGAFRAIVDERSWHPLRIEFFDTKLEPLKTILVEDLKQVDGIWIPQKIQATHHRTGHVTLFEYENIVLRDSLPKDLFAAALLTRGLPEKW